MNVNITPTDHQMKAIKLIEYWFKNDPKTPFVMAGLAGTGKTSITPFIIDQLGLKSHQVHFCAYTGKASLLLNKRGLPATTIHRLVYIPYEDSEGKVKFKRNPCLSRDLKLICVDESSMVDVQIKKDLESYGIPVLYIGDNGQLPPISASQVSIMDNPNIILTEIMRQSLDNPIIRLAHSVRNGQFVPFGKHGDTCLKIPFNKLKDEWLLKADQVLCGLNRTRHNLNRQIRKAMWYDKLRGNVPNYPIISDRLICLKNNNDSGLINGMIGNCISFDSKTWELSFENDDEEIWHGLKIEPEIFDMSTNITYKKEIDQFDFGYVITVHKFQGSSAPNILLFEEALGKDEEMKRRWLYTGITRAENKLIIVA
jgi:ATP-dependent exoDNAse (exonuclease V) alpha subunit